MIDPRNRLFLYMLGGVVIAALWWGTKQTKPLPILGEIPSFEMIDTNGSLFGSTNLKGKIWVADFIFTTCAGPLPRDEC